MDASSLRRLAFDFRSSFLRGQMTNLYVLSIVNDLDRYLYGPDPLFVRWIMYPNLTNSGQNRWFIYRFKNRAVEPLTIVLCITIPDRMEKSRTFFSTEGMLWGGGLGLAFRERKESNPQKHHPSPLHSLEDISPLERELAILILLHYKE